MLGRAQERGSEGTNSADTLTSNFEPPDYERINVCGLSTWSMALCYGILTRLTHSAF